MEFYISDIQDYINNVKLSRDLETVSELLEESYYNECFYFGLFVMSTVIGLLICTFKEPKKEYILINQEDSKSILK